MATPLPPWQVPDVIDYEYFLDADEAQPAETLHRRDREFYQQTIAAALPPQPPGQPAPPPGGNRPLLLRLWLECRRRQARQRQTGGGGGGQEVILPGEAFAQIEAGARWWLVVLGLAIGWTAAEAALAYSAGAEPINAFTFFVEFAVVQVAILLIACAVLAVRHWFPNWHVPSLMRLVLRVVAAAARNLWQRNRVRIAGETRQNVEVVFGVLKTRHTLYGTIFAWSFVLLAQAFAVSFNLGVLGAMTSRHLFHDLDFGWESTWLNAEQVSRGAEAASVPWAWLLQPAHPSKEQVRGSQNRKRDSARLDAESLKSWSHFLFGAVIFYGLLPRAGLLLLAARARRRGLDRLRFGDGRSALVLNRLRTPLMRTAGVFTPENVLPAAAATRADESPAANAIAGAAAEAASPFAAAPPPTLTAQRRLLVLNLSGRPLAARDALKAVDPLAAGGEEAAAEVFDAGSLELQRDEQSFAAIQERLAAAPEAEVFVLLAAWTPPMVATKLLLDQLRARVGRERLILLALAGRPSPDGTTFRPVKPTDRALWVAALRARGDPFMQLQP